MNRFKFPKEQVDKAIIFLRDKKGSAPSFIKKFPGGFRVFQNKLFAGDLLVVPTEQRDDYLRKIVYGKQSEYPFGRDSLFAILKHEVMNVSKRDIEAFLNSQGPLVHRRARPKREKRTHLRKIKNPGQLSVDLVHVRAKDFEKLFQPASAQGLDYMGPPGSKGYQQDRFFLNAVCMLTGYLLTEVLQGKTAAETTKPLERIIERYEKLSKTKVGRIEFDKGGEFRGAVAVMLKEKGIRKIEKVTNAVVEQKNAHMQRVFWNLVAQRRGGFIPTVKQAVRISNRTLNRRTGMNPEEALQQIAAGGKVNQKEPKAGPAQRKKAFEQGTKVRALKQPRSKSEQNRDYKAYKGQHYGRVLPILKVRYVGNYPKYMLRERVMTDPIEYDRKVSTGEFRRNKKGEKIHKVKTPAIWKWGDELIRARPADTKAHNLVVMRDIVFPKAMQVKKPKAKPKKPVFKRGQYVWYKVKGKKTKARIDKVINGTLRIKYKFGAQTYLDTVSKSKVTPMAVYTIGDKVRVYHKKQWHSAEVEAYSDKGYIVFWRQDNKRWEKDATTKILKAA